MHKRKVAVQFSRLQARSTAVQQEHIDKVQELLDSHYVSAPEARWVNFSFKLHHAFPSHQRLVIYIKDFPTVSAFFFPYRDTENLNNMETSKCGLYVRYSKLAPLVELMSLHQNRPRTVHSLRDMVVLSLWCDDGEAWLFQYTRESDFLQESPDY
ncbi:hypothetical protein PHYBLDRAFT_149862 [Phycomyces blakesleeanus NRRL 1555(-)]|uniref:Uncharacterized protein n=1 Tax=Phycomyces blakesleeanus (strain ATCC 8743b / DSM 1359 / FGSC 10004 / NBRC 33097 / NRRL 1555) TaxID=763407 RepID=A0A167KTP2_PHYB8|nr:hypothetical protein PHYBLDRAFT_149862 [Phycomyces blakesleeanus NRRL 1555(-)]OAD68856.1 hypothetical protein PHYBLDRAFT_149862 [Phycomyces blakesleeanus NRRL 1555(-)]|eukprot:XP_018286896.1 hypothetical protein PHYBLDRAFT_149862 [Phycomyces blakesleeanus NRRL 1555(-)]